MDEPGVAPEALRPNDVPYPRRGIRVVFEDHRDRMSVTAFHVSLQRLTGCRQRSEKVEAVPLVWHCEDQPPRGFSNAVQSARKPITSGWCSITCEAMIQS